MRPHDKRELSPEGQVIMGYYDGLHDTRDELPKHSNFTKSYVHGWNNGRDDRSRRPRAPVHTLREEWDRIVKEEQGNA